MITAAEGNPRTQYKNTCASTLEGFIRKRWIRGEGKRGKKRGKKWNEGKWSVRRWKWGREPIGKGLGEY